MLSDIAHYPPDCAPRAWTKAASGFSGAEVYRLETARGTLVLRRWPAEHPSPERLSWIHTVLTQAVANGFDRLPLPIRISDGLKTERVPLLRSSNAGRLCGETFVSHDGHLWELAPWLPGEADFRQNTSPARLTAAMQALAQLHLAMAKFQPNPQPIGSSPGLAARLEQLRAEKVSGTISRAIRDRRASTAELIGEKVSGTFSRSTAGHPSRAEEKVPDTFSPLLPLASGLYPLASSPGATGSASAFPPQDSGLMPRASIPLLSAAHEILAHFDRLAPDLERQLAAHVDRPVPLQPALRDIHDEHVLFVGDQVTGIIDFGAMRIESVAGDIARLLGSLVGAPGHGGANDRHSTWQAGLSAYEAVRPLSPLERELVDVFDRSGLLLGGMNWLQWLFVEGRQFSDLPRVRARLTAILARLRG